MPTCQFLKRKHRKICIGDLDTLIKLQSRDIVPPVFDSVDFDEDIQDLGVGVFAKIETAIGKTVFDGINTDVSVTHKITIRYDDTITTENRIELDGEQFDIKFTENLENRSEWLLMFCNLKGVGEAAKS